MNFRKLIISVVAFTSALTSAASVNLKFEDCKLQQIEATNLGDNTWQFLSLGSKPAINCRMLGNQGLTANDTHLIFEYKSTTGSNLSLDIIDADAVFNYVSMPTIAPSEDWTLYTADISKAISKHGWGNAFDWLRMNFGAKDSQITIRNLRIGNPTEEYVDYVEAEDDYFNYVLSLGLPVVKIETIDREEPTYDLANPPQGSIGGTIKNATKVPGSVVIYEPDGSERYNSGDYVKSKSGMTVKIRGNGTARVAKKPYKIKLQKKADLFNRGDSKCQDKNWVLITDTPQRAMFGFKLSEIVGMEFAPGLEYVNVWFNGDYCGIYALAESVERGESRIDVDKNNGYIIELDQYWWNEPGYVNSKYLPILGWTFKYPDYEDMTPEQITAIGEYISNFEASLTNSNYTDYIDVESFAKFILVHDILGTYDTTGVNQYYKVIDLNADDKKVAMPVIWDLETIESISGDWSNIHSSKMFTDLFGNTNNLAFIKEYINQWNNLKPTIKAEIDNFLGYGDDEESIFLNRDYVDAFTRSAKYDRRKWWSGTWYMDSNRQRLYNWMEARYPLMDSKIAELQQYVDSHIETGINDVAVINTSANDAIYDLFGRKVTNPAPGIYVRNGRKFVVK